LISLQRRYESKPKNAGIRFPPIAPIAAESRGALDRGQGRYFSAHQQPNGWCGHVGFRTDQVRKKATTRNEVGGFLILRGESKREAIDREG
jgi:hypothetical protein